MSRFAQRLSQVALGPTGGRRGAPFSPGGLDSARCERIGTLVPPTQTRHGLVQLIDRVHGPGFVQGRVPVAPARQASGPTLAALSLDEGLAGVDASRMLLMDTETTGLHGGAGTLPFLVGMGWFDEASLVVRQLFLGQPGEERPLLRMLAEQLEASSVLVTFNGKCFDWPLLRTRFVLNRVTPPPPRPHLDLLHCARRVFKRRLGATRLQDLEAAVLGFHREGDLEGSAIPAVYFDWLRRGARGLLDVVLEHNVRDLVSMAAVLTELCRRFDAPASTDDAADCLSLAVVAVRAGDAPRAERFALAAAERATGTVASKGAPASPGAAHQDGAYSQLVLHQALLLASRCAAQRRDFEAAVERAERAVAAETVAGVPWELRADAHLVLARLYEFRLRRAERALEHARLATAAEAPAVNARRIARLLRRIDPTPEQPVLALEPRLVATSGGPA